MQQIAILRKSRSFLVPVMIWLQCIPAHALDTDAWLSRLTQRIPHRRPSALTGSQFADFVSTMDEQRREQAILEQLLQGNLPDFLRKLKPVRLQHRLDSGQHVCATMFVAPDYLAIGSQADFIRIPMAYHTASLLATRFGFVLPTRKMVDAIYEQSAYHFTPQPMTPGPQMRSTAYYKQHNRKIKQQRVSRAIPLGELVSGHKKDVVITRRLSRVRGRVAIYGWHRPSHVPIQPLSTVHGSGYADYSHGIRLISEVVLIDGKIQSIYDVLQDPDLAFVFSDEGPIPQLRRLLDAPATRLAALSRVPAYH